MIIRKNAWQHIIVLFHSAKRVQFLIENEFLCDFTLYASTKITYFYDIESGSML